MSARVSTLPFQVAESITRGGTTFEVLEYGPLAGSEPFAVAEHVSGRLWIAPTQPLYETMRSALGSAGGKPGG
jgi:hypothetical protein